MHTGSSTAHRNIKSPLLQISKIMKVLIFFALVLQVSLALPMEKENRIVGGYPASPGQFPHQVSLQLNGQHACGGSIISPYTILTAAHCVYGVYDQLYVLAGVTDLNENGVRVAVGQIVIHANYNPNTFLDDIAILRLSSALPIEGYIQIAPLRGQGVNPGETLTLSGWGRTSYPGNLPSQLHWIQLAAIDLNTCSQLLAGSTPIGNGHVCTSSPVNEGSCQGDSGGPLIDAYGNQIGVVSWGIPCAKGYPDVFTSVPYYWNWIVQSSKSLENVHIVN